MNGPASTQQQVGTSELVADERYRLLFHRNPFPMWVYDVESNRFLAVNDAAVTHYGYSRDQFLAMSIGDLVTGDDHEAGACRSAQGPDPHLPGACAQAEAALARHVKADGSLIDAEIFCDDLPFGGRRAKLVVATDVTARTRAQSELQRRAAQQAGVAALGAQALEGSDIGELIERAVAVVAEGLGVEFCELLEQGEGLESLTLRAGLGWRAGLVRRAQDPGGSRYYTGFTWGSLGHIVIKDFSSEPRFLATPRLAAHGVVSGATVIVGRRGRPFGLLGAYSATHRDFSPDDVIFLKTVANVLADAIQRQRSEDHIRHQALHDALTGLPNRTLLLERLNHWLDRAQRTDIRGAVLFVDLDHFKLINDALGHDAGDQLLLEVASRLGRSVRASDTVARLGGDEFVVFCEDIASEHSAYELAERVASILDAPFPVHGRDCHVTASIGIAMAARGTDADSLLRDSDAAMYRAKEMGRARFELYDEEMRERSHQWLQTERELRLALGRGELHNLYQPIVATDGSVTGFEALVRWEHPERGTITPDSFIPIAEESGLIVAIGRAVLQSACLEATRWPAPGPGQAPLSISVNLSALQVTHPGLVQTVADVLADTGLEASRLNLEITESVLIGESQTALKTLNELKGLGVKVVLDDFGTGFSSLAYVKRFPIDTIKIDRSFIGGLPADPENGAIVRAVISMGRALGVSVVAEGVETRAQADELESLGCNLAQGYLFARPLTPQAAAELLKASLPAPSASA
jgi:diguanylate cyclase (GGDEF)-like protein/PAS domain S-box-containing protein